MRFLFYFIACLTGRDRLSGLEMRAQKFWRCGRADDAGGAGGCVAEVEGCVVGRGGGGEGEGF